MKRSGYVKVADSSLFNAADEAIAEDISFASFEESLLANILFQERILLHEAYFFSSSHLIHHIENSHERLSLFELGAREGIITPAFRVPGTTTLDESFKILNRFEAHGGSHVGFPDKIDYRLRRMMNAVQDGFEVAPPFYWPGDSEGHTAESVGQGYERIVKKYLSIDEPPIRDNTSPERQQLFERVWEQSKRWRFDCVEEACKRTSMKGGSGLQRGELFKCIAWSIGMSCDQIGVKPSQWKEYCSDDPEKALALEVFYRWCNQCHHLNLSEKFKAGVNLPAYDLDSDFIADYLLGGVEQKTIESFESFHCTIRIPEFRAILSLPATEILSIRRDLGGDYRRAVENYLADRTPENRGQIVEAISLYSESLCLRVSRYSVHNSRVDFLCPGSKSESFARIASSVGALLTNFADVGIYVAAIGSFTIVYPILRRALRRRETARSLKPRAKTIELNLPKKDVSANMPASP